MKLNTIKVLLRNNTVISLILLTLTSLVLLGVVIYSGFWLYAYYQEINTIRAQVDTQQEQVQLIRNNKQIVENNLTTYNDMLNSLIPDKETYFQVIAALQQLETRTGVTIDTYTLNLTDTTEDKLSLSLSVIGSREAVEKLLEEYHFISGRLLTNENISLSLGESLSISFQINLVHKPYEEGVSDSSVQIAQEDVAFLEEVRAHFMP